MVGSKSRAMGFLLIFASLLLGVGALPLGNLHANVLSQLVRRGEVSPSNAELLQNTIGFGAAGIISFILRCINRGWVLRRFHLEDYLMCVTMCFYIVLLFLINYTANYATNLYPPEQAGAILSNPVDVANRIYGSKLVIPLEQSMIATTWGVKLCIWVFLLRLCRNLPQYETALWILFGYIWLGFCAIEIVYYGFFCQPFSQYWAVPVSNMECATYHNYSIVQMVFNISSDLALIIIPSFMVRGSKLPKRRKCVLYGIFSLAGFTIIAAVMNKYYNFQSPLTTVYQLWYIRESSVSILVGNLICTWQLLQKLFHLRSFDNKNADIRDDPAFKVPQFLANKQADANLNIGNWRKGHEERGVLRRLMAGDLSALGGGSTWLSRLGGRTTVGKTVEGKTVVDGGSEGNSTVGGTPGADACEKKRDTLFTQMKDGDDASAAIRYREEHKIE